MAKASPGKQAARASYHHGDLRRTLLEAARAEIAENGAQGLSLSSLARRAGVAQSAPYRHFADRDDLLAAVATAGFEAFAATLLDAQAQGDEAGALRRMAAAYLRFGEDNIELYRLMFASRLVPDSTVDSPLSQAALASFEPLRARLGAAPEGEAVVVWGQLHGLVMLKADRFVQEPLAGLLDFLDL